MSYQVAFLVTFRKDIPAQEAHDEWKGSHGDLALTLPGLRRYVQHHFVGPAAGHVQQFDGIVELGFDDQEAFEAAFVSPAGKAMLEDDLRLFDRSGDPAYIGGQIEQVVKMG